MTTRKSQTTAKTAIKEVVENSTETAESTTTEVTNKVIEFEQGVKDGVEKLQTATEEANLQVQGKLKQLKQDLLQQIDILKEKLGISQKDYVELKEFVKAEMNLVIEDLSKLTKEIKEDVSQLSTKHKESLSETFKRSKDNTLEVYKKILPTKSSQDSSQLKN